MIKLSKCFRIGSLEKVPMSKNHRGSVIGDKFYRGKIVCCDPSGFSPILIKRVEHRLSTIYFHSSLTFVLPIIYRRRRGIGYQRYLYAKNLTQTKNSFCRCRWRSVLGDYGFPSGSFFFFEFLLLSNLSALGEVFDYRFLIQVLS
jgi:hypothetical protein